MGDGRTSNSYRGRCGVALDINIELIGLPADERRTTYGAMLNGREALATWNPSGAKL
jgi:hypothetical protein